MAHPATGGSQLPRAHTCTSIRGAKVLEHIPPTLDGTEVRKASAVNLNQVFPGSRKEELRDALLEAIEGSAGIFELE